jgi:hypothetical protein
MPLISNIKHKSLQRHIEQNEIEATYDIIHRGGETFLQITTCGSPSRECPGKTSQVMRFNKQSIEQLKQIIQVHF